MTSLQMYFLVKLDDIIMILGIFSTLLLILCACLIIFSLSLGESMEDIKTKTKIKKFLKLVTPCAIFLTFAAFLIPSTKQMATIIVVPKIINMAKDNKELMSLPNNIIILANEWIQKLSPDNILKSDTTIKK